MKTILLSILFIFSSVVLDAQGASASQLFSAIEEAEAGKNLVKESRKASNLLVKQLSVTFNPNATQFLSNLVSYQNGLIDRSDNIQYYTENAWSLSGQGFNKLPILNQGNLIYGLVDEVNTLGQQIVEAVQTNNTSGALSLISTLNTKLQNETQTFNRLITRCNNAISIVRTYQVCIRTVDSNGNEVPATDLFGFYGINNTTGAAFYPDNQEGTCFTELPSGSYTFDSFNGYFSGTGSNSLTLSQGLINSEGVIVVDLVYWSE